jgi:hypothetical protein
VESWNRGIISVNQRLLEPWMTVNLIL